jgi:hypothetical protein
MKRIVSSWGTHGGPVDRLYKGRRTSPEGFDITFRRRALRG